MAFRRVIEFKEISMQYSSNGPATLDFLTDITPTGSGTVPGALASALSAPVAIAPTSGVGRRQTAIIPIDNVRGTEFQVKITPGASTQFELYEMLVQIRPIGVYLYGGAPNGGEIWQTVPIAPGI